MKRRRFAARASALVVGTTVVIGTAALARDREITPWEHASFRVSNDLHDATRLPLVATMQIGSLGGGLAMGAVLAVTGRRRAGMGIAAGVTGVWGAAKVLKRVVGRGRPAEHLEVVRVRGAEQRGLGYPSGHAAVATAVAVVGGRAMGPWATVVLPGAAAVTGLARMYVGAHLPLDIIGGTALGLVGGTIVNLALDLTEDRRYQSTQPSETSFSGR